MSKRRLLLLGLPIVLLLAAAIVVWYALPNKVAVTIEVTGSSELTVKATCDIDGTPQELTFTGSTKFVLEGYRVTYSLVGTEGAGEFRVWAINHDKTLGSAGSGNPPANGVRGWVKSSWWRSPPTHWIEAFNKDEQQPWLTPPP
jgi:hypothetical protein